MGQLGPPLTLHKAVVSLILADEPTIKLDKSRTIFMMI